MKILFCSHTGAFSGGAEKSMLLLIQHLIKKGHNVTVNIPDSKKDYILKLEKLNIKNINILKDSDKTSYDSLSLLNKISKISKRIFYVFKIKEFIKQEKFDLVYLNTIRTTSELIAAKMARKKTIIHLRGFDTKSKFRYKLLSLSNRIVVLNNYAKTVVSKFINNNRIVVIPNGVKINEFSEKDFKEDNLNIIHIGSYEYRKGSDLIFKTLNIILNNPNIIFHHVGKSKPEDEFSEQILHNNKHIIALPNFIEHNYLENDELLTFLKKMHIFLLPSRVEGLPRTVLESMERGLVCVISDIPEHDELVENNVNGVKIDFMKSENIENLNSILSDRTLLKKISNKARKHLETNYDIQIINERIINLIIEVYEA